ncbi:MAG: hypothetical protein KA184_12230 [Candidatus Hydrogenedentes bacterium]|nr:hypothetical protein [Candidatus Hydrogenedentota bacterium]
MKRSNFYPLYLIPLLALCALLAAGRFAPVRAQGEPVTQQLRSITINTQAYSVAPGGIDRRTARIVAPEDMHIAGIEHFNGVQKGGWSDNGHLLSLVAENPWEEWADAGTGMEPTGAQGYFGYCGRDYYTEVGGIGDVVQYEMLPGGTCFHVPKGGAIYLHCYANNFLDRPQMFHHAVRLLYW